MVAKSERQKVKGKRQITKAVGRVGGKRRVRRDVSRRTLTRCSAHCIELVLFFLPFYFFLLPPTHAAAWTRQRSGTMAWLRAVYFLDQNHGWVAGSGGTLLETGD